MTQVRTRHQEKDRKRDAACRAPRHRASQSAGCFRDHSGFTATVSEKFFLSVGQPTDRSYSMELSWIER
jgi:hypothetical protein